MSLKEHEKKACGSGEESYASYAWIFNLMSQGDGPARDAWWRVITFRAKEAADRLLRNRDDAADVAQVFVLRLLVRAKCHPAVTQTLDLVDIFFEEELALKLANPGYSTRAGRYGAIDVINKIKKDPVVVFSRLESPRENPDASGSQLLEGSSPPSDLPDHDLLDSERQQLIALALNELPPVDREAVLVCDGEEKSYTECARVLDVPIPTFKTRLIRGRMQLRALLGRAILET